MTAHRRPAIPFSDAPRGTCRWCGETILYAQGPHEGEIDRRRRWHPTCVEIYNASDPREARRLVRKRDRTVCARCGVDTNKLRRQLREEVARVAAEREAVDGKRRSETAKKRASTRGLTLALRERGFKARQSLWELDHVVPLIDGGDHGLENLQTLCTPCHKEKTIAEARERAERRAVARATAAAQESEPPVDARIGRAAGGRASTRTAEPLRDREGADLDTLLDRAGRLNERIENLLGDIRQGARR